MPIVIKPSTTKIFDELFAKDETEPKVHNKHHRTAPDDAVYIGRGSTWGNPWPIGQKGTRKEVIELYRVHVLPTLDVTPLRGKHLVCFCKPQACHGDLLLEAANK